MAKYFKNDKKITVESILSMYSNYDWGPYPYFDYNTSKAQNLMAQCHELEEYTNWVSKC